MSAEERRVCFPLISTYSDLVVPPSQIMEMLYRFEWKTILIANLVIKKRQHPI